MLMALPLPMEFLLKGCEQTNKIFKAAFCKLKIMVALKTYLSRRDRHKEHEKIFPSHFLEDTTSSPHFSASISNARSGTAARRIFCNIFPSGTVYKLQAKHIPPKHSHKARKAYFISKHELVQSLKTNYQIGENRGFP